MATRIPRRLVSKINRLNPQARIALIGCQAQIQKERLTELPNVYWVVGNAKKFDLPKILQELDSRSKPKVIARPSRGSPFTIPAAVLIRITPARISRFKMAGDFFCSFCEIPYARGRSRSREFQDILNEAHILAEAGHREIILTGINVERIHERATELHGCHRQARKN